MPAPAEIVQLVELFERNYDQYRDPAFTEAAARHQFIDPFFAALGDLLLTGPTGTNVMDLRLLLIS